MAGVINKGIINTPKVLELFFDSLGACLEDH